MGNKYLINCANVNLFGIEVEVGFKGLLSSSVEHLSLDLGAFGQPIQEENLGGVEAVMGGELNIESGESVLVFGELVEQLGPVLVPLADILDHLHV